MEELVKRIKKECATAYYAAQHHAAELKRWGSSREFKTYGCSLAESDIIYASCCRPRKQFWYFSKLNPFLPKDFRKVMYAANGRRGKFENNQFFIFHYKVNSRAVCRDAKKTEALYKRIKEREKITAEHGEQIHESVLDLNFDAKEFMNNFYERFHPASVILPFFTGTGRRNDVFMPHLIGRRDFQKEIMTHMKKEPENGFKILEEIAVLREDLQWIREHTNSVHIYDLLGRPKEVHYEL